MASTPQKTLLPPPDPMVGNSAHIPDARYLAAIGTRVRETRVARGLTRKALAKASSVSERYLAQLEAGDGNASVLLLRQIARALLVPLETLLTEAPAPTLELLHATEALRRLVPAQLERASRLLAREFAATPSDNIRTSRVALIGLRGAGKSTLGAQLAEHLGWPFIELDRRIETHADMKLTEIFDLYGRSGYRRLERECLQNLVQSVPQFVVATGGGIASDPIAFELLTSNCRTIWLRATPEEHMSRVMAQGDLRPMQNHKEAMADLRKILAGREPFYRRADAILDTSGKTLHESLRQLVELVRTVPAPNGETKVRKIGKGRRS